MDKYHHIDVNLQLNDNDIRGNVYNMTPKTKEKLVKVIGENVL